MKSKTFNFLVFLAFGTTVVAIYAYPHLPAKRKTLIPGDAIQFLYADIDEEGQNGITWLDEENHHWRCFRHLDIPMQFCGYNLLLNSEPATGTDLSGYERMDLKISYRGTAENLRVFLRHYDPSYSSVADSNSAKFISAGIQASELNREISIGFDEFRVADWWLYQFGLTRQLSKPQYSNIIALGIDFAEPVPLGDHDIKVEKLEFVGLWVAEKDWYLGILAIWMIGIFIFLVYQWLRLRRHTEKNLQRIRELARKNMGLQTESEIYKQLSTIDALTGAYNRRGIEQAVQKLLDQKVEPRLALILMDIDHFKLFNDRHGHTAGDRVLKQVASIIMGSTRSNDGVGRWGGEEFILICPQTDIHNGFALAEKIRHNIATTVFETDGQPVKITASFGVGIIQPGEDFAETFKRIDEAMYKAKSMGRNCSVKAL